MGSFEILMNKQLAAAYLARDVPSMEAEAPELKTTPRVDLPCSDKFKVHKNPETNSILYYQFIHIDIF